MTTKQFDPNTPAFTYDSFSTSQPQLQTNFSELFDYFQQNHVPLNAATALGNHTVVQLPNQPDSQQTGLGEVAFYAKKVEGQASQLFMRYQGNGQEIQLTNYQIYSLGQLTGQTQYFSFLPGGIIVYFGTIDTNRTQALLVLNPKIARNIITVSFGGSGSINQAQFKPNVYLNTRQDGIINGINVQGYSIASSTITYFYMVMANI